MAPNDTALNTRRDDKVYAGVIQSAANSELKKKGMKIDNQNPDAIFIFDSKIEEQIVYRQSTTPNAWVGYGGYAYGYVGSGFYTGVSTGGYYNSTETHSVLIDEGVLGYTMYDRKTSKLLWRGAATQKVNNHTDFERSIKKATSFIFAKLPLKIK